MVLDGRGKRQLDIEREQRRELNALTLMPLPVRIPAEWYHLLPKVFPLVVGSGDESEHYIDPDVARGFLEMWGQRLMKDDGDYVWIHLGGVEAYETIPAFAKGVETKIKGRDQEVREQGGGLKDVIEHWRNSVEDLRGLDDKDVLEARKDIIHTLEPLMSTVALSGAWAVAYSRSCDNIYKFRETVRDWMAKYGDQYDLDLPFGGKIEASVETRLH